MIALRMDKPTRCGECPCCYDTAHLAHDGSDGYICTAEDEARDVVPERLPIDCPWVELIRMDEAINEMQKHDRFKEYELWAEEKE